MWDFSKINLFNSDKPGKITCIYGDSGSGKSTLAHQMKTDNTIVIDGDSLRYYVNNHLTFSDSDRLKNNITAAGIARLLSSQGFDVIISTVRADLAYKHLCELNVQADIYEVSKEHKIINHNNTNHNMVNSILLIRCISIQHLLIKHLMEKLSTLVNDAEANQAYDSMKMFCEEGFTEKRVSSSMKIEEDDKLVAFTDSTNRLKGVGICFNHRWYMLWQDKSITAGKNEMYNLMKYYVQQP